MKIKIKAYCNGCDQIQNHTLVTDTDYRCDFCHEKHNIKELEEIN